MDHNHPLEQSEERSDATQSEQFTLNAEKPAATELTDGEVLRIELYEEAPTIGRETFIREKVQIKKISTQEAAE